MVSITDSKKWYGHLDGLLILGDPFPSAAVRQAAMADTLSLASQYEDAWWGQFGKGL